MAELEKPAAFLLKVREFQQLRMICRFCNFVSFRFFALNDTEIFVYNQSSCDHSFLEI